jgi:hypothetical protein
VPRATLSSLPRPASPDLLASHRRLLAHLAHPRTCPRAPRAHRRSPISPLSVSTVVCRAWSPQAAGPTHDTPTTSRSHGRAVAARKPWIDLLEPWPELSARRASRSTLSRPRSAELASGNALRGWLSTHTRTWNVESTNG